MRIGEVVKVIPAKKIGFIRSEGLREDVFFHFSIVQKLGTLDLQEGEEVEFEIDELDLIEKRPLKAKVVLRPTRPLTMRLQPSDAPELNPRHHPNARRKRPSWRNKEKSAEEEE